LSKSDWRLKNIFRLEAEKYLEKKCQDNGINFSVVYFGDVYGSKGWFYDILVKRLQKKSFRLPSGGKYFKGFVNVDDAVGISRDL
jgi:nucleoside-diphosphate-sugar epimerase